MKSFYIIVATVISILAFSGGVYLGRKSGYEQGMKEKCEFTTIDVENCPCYYKNEVNQDYVTPKYVDAYDSIYQRQINY